MFTNNIALIFRRFTKNKAYTAFNIVGLAVGFSVVIYISLFINHELTYDKFQPGHESIFRLSAKNYALTSPSHLGYLTQNTDEIVAETFLLNSGNFLIGTNEDRFIEPKAYYVTGDFFNVFDYQIARGSYEKFSERSNGMVITETMEQKLFGDESALNKEVIIYQGDEENIYQVMAVLKDLPSSTHLKFNMIVHMPSAIFENGKDNWGYTVYHGYVKTKDNFSTAQFQKKVDRIFAKRVLDNNWLEGAKTIEDVLASNKYNHQLALRIDDIYFKSNMNFDLQAGGDVQNLWVFGATALFILILAIMNFINLATAQSAKKAKEVGVRKTLGSTRSKLIAQFMTESIVLCLIAALLSLGIVEFFIPLMKSFLNFDFTFSVITNPTYLVAFLVLAILTGVLGGLYPAFHLTAFKPAAVLKGKMMAGESNAFLRNALVVFQFTISIALGIFVYSVQDQLKYGLEKDPGFQRENLITIDNSLEQLGGNAERFKNQVRADSRFVSAGYFNFDLIGMSMTSVRALEQGVNTEPLRVYYQWVDSTYLSTLGVEVIAGRGFNKNAVYDTAVIVLNETAVKQLGLEDPIGRMIEFGGSPGDFKIVGVVKDFHHQSFRKEVPPTGFVYSAGIDNAIAIRVSEEDLSNKIAGLQEIWAQNTPQPFDYKFIDEDFARLFEKEQRLSKIISVFTFLAFFVATLGLLGLAGYLAERKTKEIGIRKTLGATVEQIVSMFSGKFLRLVFISILFAVPIAYYAINIWLDAFVYKIAINPISFVIICIAGVVVVLAAVSFHAIKSAMANPVKALKEE